MKRARCSINSMTSDWFLGGTLTVVIWVTTSLLSLISGMGVLLDWSAGQRAGRRPGCGAGGPQRCLALGYLTLPLALRDRLRDRHRPPRHLGVQALDHAAVEFDHALVLVLRQIECG